MTVPSFQGTHEEQQLAAEVFRLMVMQGSFFAEDAPIKQTLNNLTDFLARQRGQDRGTLGQAVDEALQVNSHIFKREQHEDDIVFITSRRGTHPQVADDTSHTFQERLYQPENPLPLDDISVVVSTSRPALTTVEPVFISEYWQQQAELAPAALLNRISGVGMGYERRPGDTAIPVTPLEIDIPVPPISTPPRVTQEPVAVPTSSGDSHVDNSEAASITWPEVEPVPAAMEAEDSATEPLPPVGVGDEVSSPTVEEELPDTLVEAHTVEPEDVESPEATTVITLGDGTQVDMSQSVDAIYARHRTALETALIDALERDPLRRIVRFGNLLHPESGLSSLGKNDLRRIRDDIMEAGEPLSDTAIISDLYHNAQRQPDYQGFRFSLNYRLSREKDFEFVGVEGACLWSVKGLPVIGSKRIKASEMAQMTSYLVEGYDDSLEGQSIESIQQSSEVSRLLTFFEWVYGVLVFDGSLAALLPRPMLAEQRSAVLRIESPQHYTSYLVEVRYPTGNRGGWVQGLEDFFQEHLVAGAMVTLSRTEEPNVFTLVYEEIGGDSERILTLDEKKNKFAFADVNYFCAVDNDLFLSQRRFGRLKNLKALPMNERRKADFVLKHVFEVVGDQSGSRNEPAYQADLDTLYVGCSVLRPVSRSFLKALLQDDSAFTADRTAPDIYTYIPEPEPVDEDEEESSTMQWNYDDDDDE